MRDRLGPVAADRHGPVGDHQRTLPLYSKGGKAPFKFTSKSKSFIVKVAAPCEVRAGIRLQKALPQTARLKIRAAGNVPPGEGFFLITLRGGFRNPSGNKSPFHLGVTITQGARTLRDDRLCAWDQTAFLLAKGTGISCWW